MKEYQKEYIECRLIVLGDSRVGKKSLIKRILNISCTSTYRNPEIENQYKQIILKLRKEHEKHKKFLEEIQLLDKRKKDKKELIRKLNEKTTQNSKTQSKTLLDIKSEQNKRTKSPDIIMPYNTLKDNDNILNFNENNNSFVLKVTKGEQFFSKKYKRPPIPEHPTKIFNIHKAKICVKPFYILTPEKIDFDYNPSIDDSENEIDTEFNISLKGVKNDVEKIILNKRTIIEEDKINHYKIFLYNIFLFVFDISDFTSFKMVLKLYDLLENHFQISKMENSIICIIANKKDKKVPLDIDEVTTLNDFLKENNYLYYEISTKPHYNFTKFFLEFLLKILSTNHQLLIQEDNFKSDLEKLSSNKSNFSKSKRETYEKGDLSIPGPMYYANIYGFNSPKELNETFNNEKMRFNTKIFYNKIGPKYNKSKSTKDINMNLNINNMNNNLLKKKQEPLELLEFKGGLINKPIQGYQFGIVKGKLNLLKLRHKLILERNESLKDSLEENSSLLTSKAKTFRIKDEKYLEKAEKRRNKLYEKKKKEKNKILENIKAKHLINLQKIEDKELQKKQKIILSQKRNSITKNQYTSSLSNPDIFTSPNDYTSNNNETEEEFKNKAKRHYMDIIHPKNEQILKEYEIILKRIKKNYKKEQPYPGPNSYNIRTNITDGGKGFTITGKRKEISIEKDDPSFPDLKDEFDLIVSKALLSNKNKKIVYSPRFKKIEKEQKTKPYPNDKIWKKWEINKNEIEKNKTNYIKNNLKEKKNNQIKKIELIKKQTEEIEKLKKEILVQKGYESPSEIKTINYSQVEYSSPKFSITGRHFPKLEDQTKLNNKIFAQNINKININSDTDLLNYYINNTDIFSPLPNVNYIKPKLPNVVFNKAERFNDYKKYLGPVDLFKNGIFELKTQENFATKSPYDNASQRSSFNIKKEKSPSPAEYRIKSEFENIVEKGHKISEIRDRIKLRDFYKNSISEYNKGQDSKNNKNNNKKVNRINKVKENDEPNFGNIEAIEE